jgi:Tfp pilus assembly protein PilX
VVVVVVLVLVVLVLVVVVVFQQAADHERWKKNLKMNRLHFEVMLAHVVQTLAK